MTMKCGICGTEVTEVAPYHDCDQNKLIELIIEAKLKGDLDRVDQLTWLLSQKRKPDLK